MIPETATASSGPGISAKAGVTHASVKTTGKINRITVALHRDVAVTFRGFTGIKPRQATLC